jgi:hypothetical protein
MDKSKIPKGRYCYHCPYWTKINHMLMNYNGFAYAPVIECKYLKISTAHFWLKGEYYPAWLLYDMCKLCGENEE